jgi:hypothetical protein
VALRVTRVVDSPTISVVLLGHGGVRVTKADGNAVLRVVKVHDGKSRKIGLSWRRLLGDDVEIGLRPSQAESAAHSTDEAVLNVGELSAGGGTDAVDHQQRVHDISSGGEVVRSAIDGVGEAICRVACTVPEQGIGDGSVAVVDDSNRSGGG